MPLTKNSNEKFAPETGNSVRRAVHLAEIAASRTRTAIGVLCDRAEFRPRSAVVPTLLRSRFALVLIPSASFRRPLQMAATEKACSRQLSVRFIRTEAANQDRGTTHASASPIPPEQARKRPRNVCFMAISVITDGSAVTKSTLAGCLTAITGFRVQELQASWHQ